MQFTTLKKAHKTHNHIHNGTK